MHPIHSVCSSAICLILLLLITACGGNGASGETPIATPVEALTPPRAMVAEEPLQGQRTGIPSVFIVSSRQSLADVAKFLRTTPEQLAWVNPRLGDVIMPGTLMVIPSVYRVANETLPEIAKKTGVREDDLRAYNPDLKTNEQLAEGTLLVMPRLHIILASTSLTVTAQTLGVSTDTLLSSNDMLTVQEELQTGTVLIIPPAQKE
ncbi:MAG: LysM domain-containing protein [Caldilineaceae bacterium]